MATSGGFGGPALPMGDLGLTGVLVLLIVIGIMIFLVTRVFDV